MKMDASTIDKTENINLELMTAGEAAQLLRVSPKTVYVMMQTGEIAVVKFGRSVRIRRQDLEDFIIAHLNGSN
jgi:excisionase family DNA binding protein